jgi:uncharacterized protein (UPF0548 family)
MKIRLASCRGTAFPECAQFAELEPAYTTDDALRGKHAVDRIAIPEANLHAASERLWTYNIFAAARMEAHICTPDGRVALGATIIQRIFVGPIAIETAVRVITCSDDGFEYITLPGHPERGIARFTLRDGHFEIESWSRPGSWLTMLGAPFTRWMQRTSTMAALNHVAGIHADNHP